MAGRPTEYTPELLEKAKQYLNNLPEDEVVHSVEGLADFINVHRSTIYDWLKDDLKSEFSDIVESVLRKQAKKLASKGLLNEFNASITKLMLTKHGYSDKTDLNATGNLSITFDPVFNEATRQAETSSEQSGQVQNS